MGADWICWIVTIKCRSGHVAHVLVVWLEQSSVSNIPSEALLLQDIHHRIESSKVLSVCWLSLLGSAASSGSMVFIHLAANQRYTPTRVPVPTNFVESMSDNPFESDDDMEGQASSLSSGPHHFQ
jgi:hypothetical protein